jgi:hypothetical protein
MPCHFAVAGMSCISPIAPFGEVAPGWKFDSARITALTRLGSRSAARAVSRISGSKRELSPPASERRPMPELPGSSRIRFTTLYPGRLPRLLMNVSPPGERITRMSAQAMPETSVAATA